MKRLLNSFLLLFVLAVMSFRLMAISPEYELKTIKKNYVNLLSKTSDEAQMLVDLLSKIEPEKEVSDQAVVELQQKYPFDIPKLEGYLSSQKQDGTWPDINYEDRKRSGWEPKRHAERILELAKLYVSETTPYHQSPKVADAIHKALNYWFTEKPVCLNWWYNQIGVPKTLGAAFILFEDQLTEEEKQGAIEVMKHSKFGMTGQNKVWLAGNVLIRGLLQNDYNLVKEARDIIVSEVVTGQEEGIKSDWSFHQHGPQQQFGNYGLTFLSGMSFYSSLFSGTSLAMSKDQLTILSTFIKEGYRWILWKGYMDINGLDRQLFHNAPIHKAFSAAFAAIELAGSGHTGSREAAQYIIKDNYLPRPVKNGLVGHKHFWDSDQTIHRAADWMSSLKMSSSRVIGTELVNEDNLLGYYMGDGALYTYIDGDEYLNVFPFWDWRKIPGITSYETDLPLPKAGRGSRNQTGFVGGVTDEKYGITVMDLNRNKLHAHKTWIFTDEFILCLGTGIQTDSALTVTTSIDQRLKRADLLTLVNKQWKVIAGRQKNQEDNQRYYHDKTGYIVVGNAPCMAMSEQRSGQWRDFMQMYRPATVQGEVISLHLDHGVSPQNASYHYFILPATSKEKVASFDVSKVRVVRNDPEVQAVALAGEQVYFVSAHQPGKVNFGSNVTFDFPEAGVYMIRDDKEGRKVWHKALK